MKKNLVRVGKGLGIVIDLPVLELLKISEDTELEISTDGRRLILEPVRLDGGFEAPRVDLPSVHTIREPTASLAGEDLTSPRFVLQLLDELEGTYRMSNEDFRVLHHARRYLPTINGLRKYCSRPDAGHFRVGDTNARTTARLLRTLQELRRNTPWSEAVARALAAHPKDPD